jgi:membrane protease YdiL (CAAX protease family)
MHILTNPVIKSISKAILFCAVFTALFTVFSFAKSFIPNNLERLAHGIIGTIAAALTTIVFIRIDKKNFAEIGLKPNRKTIVHFFSGFGTGIMLMVPIALGIIYFSDLTLEWNSDSSIISFLWITLYLIPLAFLEELAFRAYPLEILKNTINIRYSIILTSILFALYHIANGWSVTSAFMGPAIWGLIFGIAALYSKGIAMPTGIHYAANLSTLALGANDFPHSVWKIRQKYPIDRVEQGMDWNMIIPAIILFLIAMICIELYRKRQRELIV